MLIDGSPRIYSKVHGGIHGDVATASMTVNAIPHVLTAAPGLRTMRDMPLPSFFGGPLTSNLCVPSARCVRGSARIRLAPACKKP